MKQSNTVIRQVGAVCAAVFPVLIGGPGSLSAQTAGAKTLPAALAVEAANEAVNVCAHNGYFVTATVVDPAGAIKVVVKGDRSTPHTLDSSRGKAYTVLTLGPIFKKDTSGELATLISANPAAAAISNVPGILLLAGGVVIKSGDVVVGAIGVGGAPGGALDEVCAKAGFDKIKDRIG